MTGFEDREDLMRELERLREENAYLKRLLFMQYEKQLKVTEKLEFPISDQAIDLFEELPNVFSLDEVFAAGEALGMDVREAAEHLRTYLQEEMLVQDVDQGRFTKSGRKPYF